MGELSSFITTYCSSDNLNLQFCFQGIYNFLVAIAVFVAFIYFIYGAILYMTSPIMDRKSDGKDKMFGALKGLFVIFISGAILYWINPNIFNAELLIYRVTKLEVPEVIIAEANPQEKLSPGEKLIDASPAQNLQLKLQDFEYISKLIVKCDNLKMEIHGVKEGNERLVATVNIKTGETRRATNDHTYVGNCDNQNIRGSHTTPKGNFTIIDKKYNPKGFVSRESGANMGTRILVPDGQLSSRGILIHGSATEAKDKNFPRTWGCIRMKNSDLAAIFDKVIPGKTKLIIQ